MYVSGIRSCRCGPNEGTLRQEGLVSMVTGSGLVVQLVLYLLIIFSVALGNHLYKARQVRIARRQSARFIEIFWDTKNLTTIHTASGTEAEPGGAGFPGRLPGNWSAPPAPKRQASAGDARTDHRTRRQSRMSRRAMKRAPQSGDHPPGAHADLPGHDRQRHPFIGLIALSGASCRRFSPQRHAILQHFKPSPGIAERSSPLATGLVAAIPAVIAYNHFARQIRVLSTDMENFSSEFLNIAERHFLK